MNTMTVQKQSHWEYKPVAKTDWMEVRATTERGYPEATCKGGMFENPMLAAGMVGRIVSDLGVPCAGTIIPGKQRTWSIRISVRTYGDQGWQRAIRMADRMANLDVLEDVLKL